MDRRISGGLALVLALVAVLVTPRILNPPVLDGAALVEPPAPAPVVGDCVRQSIGGYTVSDRGGLTTYEPVTLVPCTELHRSEIIRVEPDLGPAANPTNPAQPIDAFFTRCLGAGSSSWGTNEELSAGDWQPEVNIMYGVFGPDARQFAAGQRWAACVVALPNGELDRRLPATSRTEVPPELGLCTVAPGGTEDTATVIGCASPHTSEIFGHRVLGAGSDLAQDELLRGCVDLVTTATGRAGVAQEPTLSVVAETIAWYDDRDGGPVTLPLPAGAQGGWATCTVRPADSRKLTASLRLIGDAPLPWSG